MKKLIFIIIIVVLILAITFILWCAFVNNALKYPQYFALWGSSEKNYSVPSTEFTYKCFGVKYIPAIVGGRTISYCFGIRYDKKCFSLKYDNSVKRLPPFWPIVSEREEINCD